MKAYLGKKYLMSIVIVKKVVIEMSFRLKKNSLVL